MNRTHLPVFLTIILFAAFASGRVAIQAAAPVNVDKLKVVCVGAKPSPAEKQASRVLCELLKRLYGIDLKEVASLDGLAEQEPAIVLGRAAVAAGLVSKGDLDRVRHGGYVIKCGDNRIAIAGETPWNTYFGVAGFLEKLGMRFYTSDISKAYTPKPETRIIKAFSIFDKPVFGYRAGWKPIMRECSYITGDPRKALNPELFTKKAGSDLWIDHSAGYLIPKLLYYDQHPEYFAMGKDGKRIAKNNFTDHRTPLCLSNPDVIRISIERALKWVEMNPDNNQFGITYGDTGFWCQCPQCLKFDHAPGEYATRLLHWVNPVAKAIAKKYPNKIVTTFAYGGANKVPPKVRPEKNVWMVVATGAGCLPFFDHALAQKTTIVKNIEEWIAVAPGRVMVCEYLGAYEPAMLDQMTGRLRYYKRIGLWAVKTTYGSPSNFKLLWNYVWSRMTWDPGQDAQMLARDFILFYYGSAADPLCRFFDLTHKQYQATLAKKKPLVGGDAGYPVDYYSAPFVNKCLDCFNKAIEAAAENTKMKKELQAEKALFLKDVVNHMPVYDLSEKSNKELLEYLACFRDLSKETGTQIQFIRDVQALAMALEKKHTGYQELIEKWIGSSVVPQPIKLANGLHFSPLMFMRCDYGPGKFPGRSKSHLDFPSPPKLCAGVFMKTKGGHGQVTSSRMHLDFNLEKARADQPALLELEGQDAITPSLTHKGAANWKTSIKIFVNGKELYSGECGFVRGNWSRREFLVPADCLKAGKNRLEIQNISKRGWFAGCWCLVSDATLTFK